jgi:hypothetical protein
MPAMQLKNPNTWPQPLLNRVLAAIEPFTGARAAAERAIADADAAVPVVQQAIADDKVVAAAIAAGKEPPQGVKDRVAARPKGQPPYYSANVHPDEVANWEAHGWQVVE